MLLPPEPLYRYTVNTGLSALFPRQNIQILYHKSLNITCHHGTEQRESLRRLNQTNGMCCLFYKHLNLDSTGCKAATVTFKVLPENITSHEYCSVNNNQLATNFTDFNTANLGVTACFYIYTES